MARRNFNSGGSLGNDLPKVKISKDSLRLTFQLFKYLKPYKSSFYIGLFLLFIGSLLSLGFPFLMGKLIDASSGKSEISYLNDINTVALLLLGILTFQSVISFFRIYLFVNVGEKSLADLRKDTYKKIIHLPMSFFANSRVGEIQSRISADLAQIQDTLTTTIAELIRQVVVLSGGIALLSFTSGKLTLFMLSILPIIIVTAVVLGRMIRNVARNAQDKLAETNVVVEETLQAIQSVKAYTNEGYEVNRYTKSMNEVVKMALKGAKLRGFFASFIIFCLFGSIVAVIWYGSKMVGEGTMTIGSLTSFVLYSTFVGAAMGSFAELYSQVQKALGATQRIFDIMNEESEEISFNPTTLSHSLSGKVSFNNVSFSYPARKDIQVLSNLNFKIDPGKKLAIVGESGAGKSTLVSLLMRFYDVDSGKILIDDKNVNDISLTELRKNIGIVPQDVTLFGGSIYDNIAYGNVNATRPEVELAAEKAHALGFINSFPEKFETLVGERGIKLSGGQRQRIAIARAILKNPSILVLDEATSSLDSESEQLVQMALNNLMTGRTSLIIAHRLSTIRSADYIAVVEKGEISEFGTHDELMLLDNGRYRSLKMLQTDIIFDI